MSFSSLTPSALTVLEVYSDESVYAPGYIQPHGMLLMLQEPDLKILQISENVEQFFGISAEALLGQSLERLFSHAQVQRLVGYLAQENLELCNLFKLKTRRRVDQTDLQRKNQTFRGVMYRMVDGLTLELEPQGTIKSTHSIQFYHRLEAAIASRAKSQFLAKMSHELRTPLNAILGFTQLMNRNEKIPSEFQEDLGIISRSGKHLLTLINDVLEMSKIEAGQLQLTESCFDLHHLIHSIRDMVALKALEKGIDLIVEQHKSVPRYVYGDESKLLQILLNLLSNAIKFTTTGSVTLRLEALTTRVGSVNSLDSISTHNSQPIITLHLEVEDTGCGIAQSDIETVFKPFTQTELGRHAQGTGLGLSISRQFVRLMGGDITVQSILNQESIFTCEVLLSLVNSVDIIATETTRAVIGLEPGQPNYRILVAEDLRENRQLLVRLLESVGFEVCAAENGKDAIALWSEWHPHLILMDIQMPVMDGYETTRQIRGSEGGKDVVIIALTAYAFEEDYTTSTQVGCNDHITKPFLESFLFDKMAHYLGVRYRYREETVPKLDELSLSQKSLTAKDLQVMSPEWIIQVHQAALDLNDAELYNLIAQIPNQEQVLANALKYLVDNFQLEAIAKRCCVSVSERGVKLPRI
ncbi:MAG: response regulator [Nostoc sp.]|uniref:response regulator n=1 Tax=Nostoc sp. TaxID=1180 RepID=UPI002FEF5FCD